jgi:hypothetical protein
MHDESTLHVFCYFGLVKDVGWSFVLGRDICKKLVISNNSFITLIMQYRFILSFDVKKPRLPFGRRKKNRIGVQLQSVWGTMFVGYMVCCSISMWNTWHTIFNRVWALTISEFLKRMDNLRHYLFQKYEIIYIFKSTMVFRLVVFFLS